MHVRLINLWFALVLLWVVTGCGKHRDQQTQKMAVQTETAKSMDNLRSGDTAAYIAMVRADNETDLGFKVGGIVDTIGPARGSDWDYPLCGRSSRRTMGGSAPAIGWTEDVAAAYRSAMDAL